MSKLKIMGPVVAALFVALSACSTGPSAEELCQEMADNQKQSDNFDEVTEEQYRELRAKFSEVDDEELSENGVKLLDAVWQVQQLPEGEEMGAMAFMGTLTESMSGVAGACAKHGVMLDMMDQGN